MRIFFLCLAFRQSVCFRSQVLLLEFLTRLCANMSLLVDDMLTFDTIYNSVESMLGFIPETGAGKRDGTRINIRWRQQFTIGFGIRWWYG